MLIITTIRNELSHGEIVTAYVTDRKQRDVTDIFGAEVVMAMLLDSV